MRAAPAMLAVLLALVLASPAAALTADEMYEPETVVVVDLQLPPASVAALEAEPDEYVEGTFSLASTDGTPAGIGPFSAPLMIGVRLKGESSFRDLGGKAAFKLKFNEFVKGQKFLGLKRMTLNNMVQDPSMVHETLSYAAFRAAGVPAPRTGYADVRVNGEEFGMHLNLEALDDVAMERLFGGFEAPPQHLYEGQAGVDVLPGEAGGFEVDEGEEGDRSDLEALIAAVAATSPGFSERVAAHADLAEMTRMWALERYIAHWDGYSGHAQPNNYYLYSDPAGAFQMLPSGTDQAWSHSPVGFGPPGPALFEACFGDPGCLALYKEALLEAEAVATALEPGAKAQALAALLGPWQQLEVAPRKPFGAVEISAAVFAVDAFAAKRPAALAKFLGEEEVPAEGGGSTAAAAIPAAPAAPPSLSRRVEVDRAKLGRGMFVARLEAPPGAQVEFEAHIVTAQGRTPGCLKSAGPYGRIGRLKSGGPSDSGRQSLRCRLSPTVRRHLAVRWLRLRVVVTVELPDGRHDRFGRAIRLPRTAG